MYHPSRGGVRGGRDQFNWDDVKVDKHRENYLGHSLKAPVGRWQKGKDLHWYTRDKKSGSQSDAVKEEIRRIKEEEEQAMREALGLAPKRSKKSEGNRLDKHEYAELIKRSSTAEDLGGGHAEAAEVQGLGFSKNNRRSAVEVLPTGSKVESVEKGSVIVQMVGVKDDNMEAENESDRKKRRHEKGAKREKRGYDEVDEKRKHKKHKEKRRHDSD